MRLRLKQTIDLYFGGLLVFIFRPIVFVVGKVMSRDHRLSPKDEVCFLKMLGGGSLVIAEFESLQAAQDWADADPYISAGVYQKVVVKPFKKVLP